MHLEDWGLIDYEQATDRQMALLEKVSQGAEDHLVFCTHPPVVTLGRATQEGDIDGWSGRVVQSSRGGRATYHGPSQLVVYPLVHLGRPHKFLALKDVQAYLRLLERGLIEVLRDSYGLVAEVHPHPTGVWVGGKKLASIGVAVRRWVTYHGLAINMRRDFEAFQGIQPCGFSPSTMTSMEELLVQPIGEKELSQAKEQLAKKFSLLFSRVDHSRSEVGCVEDDNHHLRRDNDAT